MSRATTSPPKASPAKAGKSAKKAATAGSGRRVPTGVAAADSHGVIRVHGARENNLKDVSIEIPKRRLTVFTGVSGSGKSSLVFDTIAAESQRLINETYSTFVQGFMPSLARPEVDVLEGLTTAIVVDQQRIGSDSRATVGTASDAYSMLRILYSRLGKPYVGPPNAFSFNVATVRASGSMTVEKGENAKRVHKTFTRQGGMCQRCEGRGEISDVDLTQLYDDTKSLAEGALIIPGYTVGDFFRVKPYTHSGILDPDKPIKKFSKKELGDFLHHEPTRVKIDGVNVYFEGLLVKLERTLLSKDRDSLQPHMRAFVDRAVAFGPCPACAGTRLNDVARSCKIKGVNISDACAMEVRDLAQWVGALKEPSVGPLLGALGQCLNSFMDIGLGYLSLNRPAATLSGGEAQRIKMIRHVGSSPLTDVTYVFDEPTTGLHPHDIAQMNDLLVQLRDKGNTVLVVEHKPQTIAIADHVVDLGPGAGSDGGTVCFEGTF
ncbi:MAG TPA: excinuclease ABC subunit UvrA, partial [Acidimicrobiales bacterium]